MTDVRLLTETRSSSDRADEQFEELPLQPTFPTGATAPETFDGREQWGKLLPPVPNQGTLCGACWAFSTSWGLACRFNILSTGWFFVDLSAAKMLLCAFGEREYEIEPDVQTLEYIESLQEMYTGQFVCHGNTLADAWRYLYVSGVPTKRCFPDALRSRLGGPTVQELSTEITDTPLCARYAGQYGDKCLDGTPAKLYRARGYYQVDPDVLELELYYRGPVTTSFRIYRDFYTFSPRSQVYKSTEQGDVLGGHAVVLVGYGESKEEGKYWWVANSFGQDWGRDGYFKMVRGEDNCGIESNAVVGLPDFFQGLHDPMPRDQDFRELYESPDSQGGGLDPLTGYYRWWYQLLPDLAKPEPLIRYHKAGDVTWNEVKANWKSEGTQSLQGQASQRPTWIKWVVFTVTILLLVALGIIIAVWLIAPA